MSVHTYNGPLALARGATTVSVNGLAPASFVVDARAALMEALAAFIGSAQ